MTGRGIRNRSLGKRIPRIQLGHLIVKQTGGTNQSPCDFLRLIAIPFLVESIHDYCTVVRPHGTTVIAQRPVARCTTAHGADAVTGIQFRGHQTQHDIMHTRTVKDPRPQKMPDIARKTVHRVFSAVESDRRISSRPIMNPKAFVETSLESFSPSPKPLPVSYTNLTLPTKRIV